MLILVLEHWHKYGGPYSIFSTCNNMGNSNIEQQFCCMHILYSYLSKYNNIKECNYGTQGLYVIYIFHFSVFLSIILYTIYLIKQANSYIYCFVIPFVFAYYSQLEVLQNLLTITTLNLTYVETNTCL